MTQISDGESGSSVRTKLNQFLTDLTGLVNAATARTNLGAFPLVGTTTNDSASAGQVGETVTGSLIRSSATALTTATDKTVCSVTLTAGDWDLSAMLGFTFATGTSVTLLQGGISLTNNTLPANDTFAYPTNGEVRVRSLSVASAQVQITNSSVTDSIPTYRVSLAGTTTLYLIAFATFTVAATTAFGSITARRVR